LRGLLAHLQLLARPLGGVVLRVVLGREVAPPKPMAIEPAAISARPAVTMMPVEATAPVSPAASAKGTVNPSDIPMTMSLTTSLAVKCLSIWGVCGIATPLVYASLAPCLSGDGIPASKTAMSIDNS